MQSRLTSSFKPVQSERSILVRVLLQYSARARTPRLLSCAERNDNTGYQWMNVVQSAAAVAYQNLLAVRFPPFHEDYTVYSVYTIMIDWSYSFNNFDLLTLVLSTTQGSHRPIMNASREVTPLRNTRDRDIISVHEILYQYTQLANMSFQKWASQQLTFFSIINKIVARMVPRSVTGW